MLNALHVMDISDNISVRDVENVRGERRSELRKPGIAVFVQVVFMICTFRSIKQH